MCARTLPAPSQEVCSNVVQAVRPETVHKAVLGVRGVWVLADRRRQGIATQLLDTARCAGSDTRAAWHRHVTGRAVLRGLSSHESTWRFRHRRRREGGCCRRIAAGQGGPWCMMRGWCWDGTLGDVCIFCSYCTRIYDDDCDSMSWFCSTRQCTRKRSAERRCKETLASHGCRCCQ